MVKGIVCLSQNDGLGMNNRLLFNLPKDLAYFKKVTSCCNVIMGNNTYKSLPTFPKGLPNRFNHVLTTEVPADDKYGFIKVDEEGESIYPSENTVDLYYKDKYYLSKRNESGMLSVIINGLIETLYSTNDVWVIGGASIYEKYKNFISEWHITRVYDTVQADTFYTPDLKDFVLKERHNVSNRELKAVVEVWCRVNNP